MRTYLFIFCVVFLLKKTNAQNPRLDSLNVYLETIDKYGFSGQVLIQQNGNVIVNRAFGQLSDEISINVTNETLFGIASITKQFTAYAICLLVQQQKLNFDDTLAKFFPETPEDKSKITIHQLLTHTSGLQGGDLIKDFENISREAMIKRIMFSKIDKESKKKWRYANIGYNLLAFILEEVSGLSYEEYLTQNIFNPLGMSHTRTLGGIYSWDGLTTAKAINGSTITGFPKNWRYNMRTLGSGNIASTVSDLYKWEVALQKFTILNKKLTERLFYPHIQIHKNEFYSYGWFVFKDKNGKTRLIEHGGDYEKGYNGVIYRYIEKDITIFILSNKYEPLGANLSSRWAIFYAIRNYLTKDLGKLPYINKNISSAKNDAILGTYVNGDRSSELIITKKHNSDYKLNFEGIAVTNEILQVPDSIRLLSKNAVNKTNKLVKELVKGNLKAYKEVIERPENWNTTFAEEWRNIIKTNGEVISYKMIAAIPNLYNDGVKCIVKFSHEKGTSAMAFSWMEYGRDKLYETTPFDDINLSQILQITESKKWMTYDLFRKKWVELTFDPQTKQVEIGSMVLSKCILN